MEGLTDRDLFQALKNDNEAAFEQLFHQYYAPLCLFSSRILHDHQKAEEIVQEVFLKIWSARKTLRIGSSVKNYLFHAVRNQSLNVIEHEKVERRYHEQIQRESFSAHDPDAFFLEVGLRRKIEESICALPEKRRGIFRLSREERLTYHEIANRLGISVKTVETQMGLALKQLREMLKDYSDYL